MNSIFNRAFCFLLLLLPCLAKAQDTTKRQALKEVIVTGKKPLVKRKADRYIVTVENSYLADGNSGLDVLQKTPGLRVDANGSIRINGSQPVTVMIDDVVQRMSGDELADYLRTLRSETISKIEIIPNPPSEYEASATGGIVHIILKKARQEGLTGALYGQYRQQVKDPFASGGAMMDLKLKKIYFFGNASLTSDKSRYTGWTNVSYPDKSNFYNSGTRNNNNTRYQYRFGMAYDFSATQSVNIQTTGTGNRLLQHFYSAIDYNTPGALTTGDANSDWVRKPWLSSTTLNYGWKIDTIGSSLKIIADFTGSNKTETNTLVSVYNDSSRNSTFRTNTPSSTYIYSLQGDYTKALNDKAAFKTGAKYVLTQRHNTMLTEDYKTGAWAQDSAASNTFNYDETLLMFYASFEKLFGRTSVKAGLRGEQTWSIGHSVTSNESIDKTYFGLFPSLFINHVFNEKKGNSLHLNYSRRVKRPGYNDLNPYRLQVNDFSILTGNPNLLPQYTHSLQAGYTLRQNYTADAYFLSTYNFIAQTASTIDSNVIEHQSKNLRNSTEYGLSVNGSFTISKAWNMDNSLLLYRIASDLDPVRLSYTSFSVKTIHTITLKKIADIDIIAEYYSPYLNASAIQAQLFYMDIGFTRRVLKNKGRLRLYFSDIFNTQREKDVTQYNNTRIDFYQKRSTRTASLSFTWNFTAGKAFIKKKIDPNNSDEKSRLGN